MEDNIPDIALILYSQHQLYRKYYHNLKYNHKYIGKIYWVSCKIQEGHYKDKYESYSAGIEPTSVNPYAIEVMREIGIDLSNQYSKSINEFKGKKINFVVTVCENAKEKCPFFPGDKIIHKEFDDPEIIDGSIEEKLISFKRVRDEIKDWIIKKI